MEVVQQTTPEAVVHELRSRINHIDLVFRQARLRRTDHRFREIPTVPGQLSAAVPLPKFPFDPGTCGWPGKECIRALRLSGTIK
jgi:hypothetical protein